MRKLIALIVLALAATACGGGQEVSEDEVDITSPTSTCSEAFASVSNQEADTSSSDGSEPLDRTSLLRLTGTLDACDGFEDWMAGARSAPDALPAQMDRLTALRLLCDEDEQQSACRGLAPADKTDGSA